MLDAFKNFAKATVSTGYNSAATTVVLTTGHGAKFPAVGSTGGYNAVWWNATDYGDPSDDPSVEIVRVTAISTDTLTVTRAQESTTGTNKNVSGKTYQIMATLTAKTLNTDSQLVEIGIALSDETTSITTGTAKATFRMPFAMTLTAVRANLNTVSSSGIPTVDINMTGTGTILSTKLTIDASEFTSTTAAAAAVISTSALTDDAEITFDIDVAGTGAKGLKVWLIGRRA